MFHKYSFPCIQNIYPPGGTPGVAEEAEVAGAEGPVGAGTRQTKISL